MGWKVYLVSGAPGGISLLVVLAAFGAILGGLGFLFTQRMKV